MLGERTVRVEADGYVTTLILDRPPLNVLSIAMLLELDAAIQEAAADADAKVLVLTGEGRAFSAGVDIADHTPERVTRMLDAFHGVVRRLLDLELPVIGAVNGTALGGGCELLLACDVVIASAAAKLGQPEIRLGAFPPVATSLLPRLIGATAAADLILTGRTLSATEAAKLGLVTRVEEPDEFPGVVREYVATLASMSRPVLRLAKRALQLSRRYPPDEALRRAEALYLDDLMQLEDAHEGIAAFLEKRAPAWKEA